jgi:hypothetical protein
MSEPQTGELVPIKNFKSEKKTKNIKIKEKQFLYFFIEMMT